jgi:quercetin dioxygenase-like cupin family protein
MRLIPLAFCLFALSVFAADVPPSAIQVSAGAIVWRPGPPTLPAGTQIVVLEGDPSKEGMFTIRLKVPAGTAIAPHTHPREERVTVMSGSLQLGFGSVADRTRTNRLGAGSFYVNPPTEAHFLFFPEEAVLQLTGMGPWKLEYIAASTKK